MNRSNIQKINSRLFLGLLFLGILSYRCNATELGVPPSMEELNSQLETAVVLPTLVRPTSVGKITAAAQRTQVVVATKASPQILQGIAVMGDSAYDEYRGSDWRGGDYADVTFNLVELLVKLRGLNFGPFSDWGFPRRVGYEYNWAHSGDTSDDLIINGQHLGVAEQVRTGKVTFVLIGIGANDFSPYHGGNYEPIYSGEMPDAQLEQKITRAIDNVTLAVDTVLEAGAQGVAITLFSQWDLDPLLPQLYPDERGRQRVANAISAVNNGLRAMAVERNVIVIDQNRFGQEVLLSRLENGYLDFAGVKIDFLHNGDHPAHARLLDGNHAGTVLNGMLANYYFIDILNQHFQTNIPPLREDEIRSAAGL